MDFQPSEHQKNFFRWITEDSGSTILTAVAGSGKTTSIINALPLIDESKHVQLLAFNNGIAKELNERLNDLRSQHDRYFSSFRAGTFHSVCFAAIRRHLGNTQVTTESNKTRKILKNNYSEKIERSIGEFVNKLVGLAKGYGIGVLVKDEESEWKKLISHHGLYIDDENITEQEGINIAREVLEFSNKLSDKGYIDFDDMLYLVLKWNLKLWQNDFVFVDEAQDTNPVRREIIARVMKNNGRLIAVGDPKQAIYGFSGASHDAIDMIQARFHTKQLPLTVSFRCAKSIVKKAQEIVPYIQASETAPEGSVTDMSMKDALSLLTDHDAILCRQTAPLLSAAYSLIANGRGCFVLGKEIGVGLINLVKRMKAKNIDKLVSKLEAWSDREIKKYKERDEEEKAEIISDRFHCIMVIVDNLSENNRTISGLLDAIESLFSEGKNLLTLSTVHKAKGREWNTVAILEPELMPSKFARKSWQFEQEKNLMYVAWTRAKENLIFLTDSRIEKK